MEVARSELNHRQDMQGRRYKFAYYRDTAMKPVLPHQHDFCEIYVFLSYKMPYQVERDLLTKALRSAVHPAGADAQPPAGTSAPARPLRAHRDLGPAGIYPRDAAPVRLRPLPAL